MEREAARKANLSPRYRTSAERRELEVVREIKMVSWRNWVWELRAFVYKTFGTKIEGLACKMFFKET